METPPPDDQTSGDDPTSEAASRPSTGTPRRRWRAPSFKQLLLTVFLVGIVVAGGIVALQSKGSTSPNGTSVSSSSPATSGASGAGGATTTTIPPSSTETATKAIVFEVNLQHALGGCWEPGGKGGPDGAYRQDLYFPRLGSGCRSTDAEVTVEFFATPAAASQAQSTITAPRAVFTSGELLIVIAADAPATVLPAARTAATKGATPPAT